MNLEIIGNMLVVTGPRLNELNEPVLDEGDNPIIEVVFEHAQRTVHPSYYKEGQQIKLQAHHEKVRYEHLLLNVPEVTIDGEALDADPVVAAEAVRDWLRNNVGGFNLADPTTALPTGGSGFGGDAMELNTAEFDCWRFETAGTRDAVGPGTSIEVYNATNDLIIVNPGGVEVEATSGGKLVKDATSGDWSKFMASILLLLSFVASGFAQQVEYLPIPTATVEAPAVSTQSDVSILSAAQLQSYTTAERDALQLTVNERRLIWNLDNQQIEQWDGATWGPITSSQPAECFNVVAGPTNNPGQLDAPTFRTVGSFIVLEAGTFSFRHSARGVVGTAGIGFSRTPFPSSSTATTIVQGNLFGSSNAQRLTADKQTEDIPVTFAVDESYPLKVYVGVFSGGGSSAQSQRLDRIQSVAVPTTGFAVTTGATAGGFLTLGGAGLEGGTATITATPAETGISSELIFSYFLNSDRIGNGLPVLAEVISEGGIVLGNLEVETDIASSTIARVPFVPLAGDVTIRFTDTATGNDGSNRDLRISDVSLITIGNEKVSIGDDGLPDVVELPEPVDFTTAFEGVIVDAAPAWEGSFVLRDNIEGNLSTGVNLTEVDDIVVYFSRDVNATGANLWPAPSATIRIDDIILDVPQGTLISHFDNQFLAIANTSAAMLQAGDIRFRAESNNTNFGYEIYRIEFKKRAIGVSNRVGMREWGPSGRTPEEGYLAMTGVVVNGAVDYPIAAQRNPLFVSGNDFDFTKYEGSFVRNLGGNAADEGVLQQDQQERSPNNPVGTQVNGGGGNTVRSVTTNNETRPVNVAEQLYLIVDTYLEPNASVSSEAQTLNNAIAITSLQIEAPATGDQLPFETFTPLSGGITSNADRTAFTLPQSDTPYIVKGTAGVDLDGNPGTSNWSIELWDIGAGARLPGSTNATASAFAVTGTQSGYQFYQPDMMAIVDASDGPITIGMVLAESSTGSGGNTLDILDRTLEIEQKPTHVAPAVEDAPRQFNLRSDIPSPATFSGGTILTVSGDPVAENNGSYLILGTVGQPGTSIIPN